MKILIYLLLAWIAWTWLKRKLFAKPARPADQAQMPTEMVACSVCALHLPHTEAMAVQDAFYCCKAHLQQARAQ